ncbi:MAG TPA: AMP-dependent synthetase/ligase [Egibacteraceae bacterium]|jgi:long-chain acyl-CoA synthetase|nr:AMP-dependent synthetase/ligase [Egibacteraceae bacterium]
MVKTHAKGPDPVDVGTDQHLATRLWERAESSSAREILRYHDGGGWRGVTWKDLGTRVRKVAAGLIALGVGPGDRVALMSGTRLEWTIADLAVLAAGGVTVPIYETSSPEQCAWILRDSGARVAIAELATHAKSLDIARDDAPDLGEIFVIDDGGLDALAERAGPTEAEQVTVRSQALTTTDLASIIYTSGTTGNPKGCMLTHGNLVWTARQVEVNLKALFGADDSTLLFLPLAHVFARLIQFACLEADVQMGYARSVDKLAEDLVSYRPTFLLAVPRVFEKVFNGAQRKAEGAKRKVFDFAVATGQQWSTAVNEGRDPGLATNLKRGLVDKLVYSKLKDAMGGRITYCVSGGAPLAPYLAHFFHAAGVTILEGYGLTETTAPATVNMPDALRIGTVGRPISGVEIRIDEDGEILIKGGNVFAGYYHNEAATKEILTDDGWLRSGDLGELDDDGFLKITGRKKEIIVTAGGKNVAPAALEERLKAHRLVSQALVVGDDRPFVAALVTLDPEQLAAYAKEQGLSATSAAQLHNDPTVRAEVQKAVDHANGAVSKAESIRRFVILNRDFSQDEGELTPTLKLRRREVHSHFATQIEELYTQ